MTKTASKRIASEAAPRLTLAPVVNIAVRSAADTISTLEHLLVQARRGHIKGFIYGVKYSAIRHVVGASGDYRREPSSAIGPAMDLMDALRYREDDGG
jgi:hypothetical protein